MTITPATAATRPGRWVSIVLVVLGTIGIAYGIGGGIVRGVGAHMATSGSYTADADGLEQLEIDTSAAAFEIRFADVTEATLDVTTSGGPAKQWVLERTGSTLVVDTDRRWGWNWVGFGIAFGDNRGEEHAVLTLPTELRDAGLGLDADISAGSLDAVGTWGATVIDLSAGDVELAGEAASVSVEVSAGEARIDLSTPGDVVLQVSAGRIVGALTGEQPASIDASVSAGSIELTVPDGEYAVTESASAGSSQVGVIDDPSATSTIDVDVSAGNVVIRPERR